MECLFWLRSAAGQLTLTRSAALSACPQSARRYVLVQRCTFLYHYCPALFYAELAIANGINALPPRAQRPVAAAFMVAALVAFYIWSPWIYATPLSRAGHDRLAIYGQSWH